MVKGYFLFVVAALVGCGQPPATPPSDPTGAAGDSATEAKPDEATTDDTTSGAPTDAKPGDANASSQARAPSAELAGDVLKLTYGGETYALSDAKILTKGGEVSLRFEQPMTEGYNQLWLNPKGKIAKGKPAKVEGSGMSAAFLQLAKGMKETRNVSNDCSTSGTVTFDEIPKVGTTAKGELDVTITCQGVDALSAPLVVKGRFAGVTVKKF